MRNVILLTGKVVGIDYVAGRDLRLHFQIQEPRGKGRYENIALQILVMSDKAEAIEKNLTVGEFLQIQARFNSSADIELVNYISIQRLVAKK